MELCMYITTIVNNKITFTTKDINGKIDTQSCKQEWHI